MSEVLAGLIGVIAGGLVTGILQVIQTSRARRLECRVAARVILADLIRIGGTVEQQAGVPNWRDDPVNFDREFAVWAAQREALAAGVTTYDWYAVAMAYKHLEVMTDVCDPDQPLTKGHRDGLRIAAIRVERARQIASDHMGSTRDRKRYAKQIERDLSTAPSGSKD
jgi:hypothetical protein